MRPIVGVVTDEMETVACDFLQEFSVYSHCQELWIGFTFKEELVKKARVSLCNRVKCVVYFCNLIR